MNNNKGPISKSCLVDKYSLANLSAKQNLGENQPEAMYMYLPFGW